MENSEKNLWDKMTHEGRIITEIFVAGAGLIFWLTATVLNPVNEVKYDIVQIKVDVAKISANLDKNITALQANDIDQKNEITEHDKAIAIILERLK